ncbi:MAG: DUF5714 domain-containing protein [Bacillota bacterium]|nr:DUF5714 domain-containing protein [Bacillota bacterium]
MRRDIGACLVCGESIQYFEKDREMICEFCGKPFTAKASCEQGHYVCDRCHSRQGIKVILDQCRESKARDPILLAQAIMENPYIHMHGPEHHVLVGAVLLTAYRNCGGDIDLEKALGQMVERGQKVPGGICGFWGCCGAAVSSGMFVSIVTGSTPLAKEPWQLSNLMTSEALKAIGELGGPRCCKRDSFTAIQAAVAFSKKHLGVAMELPLNIVCDFRKENRQCIGKRCPYLKA